MSLVRKNIVNLIPYKPGKPIEEVKRELKLKKIIKLASNENPFAVSPKVKARIKKALSKINRYPEGSCYYLRQSLSRNLKLQPNQFIFGNGSDEIIDIVIKTFVEEDENVITADVTFLEYQIITKILGRQLIKVPLRNFNYDLKGILKKINRKTKVIFIANPNNPTGTYVNRTQLDSFLEKVPKNVFVVLDEAYDMFIDVLDFPKSLDYLKRRNVILMKTFSKAYGLAGLRIGYAVASAELVSYMERVRPPFNVNLLAQIAAIAALEDKRNLRKTRISILKGKKYLYRQLNNLGLKFLPSVANFILVDIEKNGCKICNELLTQGVIVRDMEQYGLDNFIRITIGTSSENKELIRTLKKVL